MIIIPVLALALAAQAAPEPVAVTPAQFAQAIQGVVGQSYEGGVTISRIYAEDQIVVIVLNGPAGWRSTASPAEFSNLFIGSFCENRDFEYFVHGNLMRVDTTEGGAATQAGPVIRACPPPAPGAHPQ
jgi:hypothetical protein